MVRSFTRLTRDTTSQQYFDAKYLANPDPWNFAGSPGENARYDALFHLLEDRRYVRAFEPGCSVGVFTDRLAKLCERVDALDISPTAAEEARRRCAHLPQVHIASGSLPEAIPDGTFDLILLSEVGYYFTKSQLSNLIAELVTRLSPGGLLVGGHWLGHSPDHLLSGDIVHRIIGATPGLTLERSERHETFRLDRWIRE